MSVWSRFPFKTLLVLGLLCFVLVEYPPLRIRIASSPADVRKCEFFPLSSFSMYSGFSDSPFYVYVTDAAGRPVAIEKTLWAHASEIKKTYERELKEIRERERPRGGLKDMPLPMRQEAGRKALELLRQRPLSAEAIAALPGGKLILHEVFLSTGRDGIERRDTVVAEL